MSPITLTCEGCGAEWHIDLDKTPVIVEPFPYIKCPRCGLMIPMF